MENNLAIIIDNLPKNSFGKLDIVRAEQEFMKHEQVDCPVVHHFGPGIYMREVRIPAGSLAIGHHQNFEHMNLFLKGKVSILNEDGTVSTLTAPMSFVGKPGRKIGYIHEEMVWINIYSTEEKDVEKLESHFLTKSYGWTDSLQTRKSIKLLKHSVDLEDFKLVLEEFGFSEKQVREMSENKSDMIDLPFGAYKIKVAKSEIEGEGLFATGNFLEDEIIGPARINGKRTICGRFANHSKDPNAKMIRAKNGDINLISIRKISGCHGGTDGEEITINYRNALKLNLEIFQEDLCQE